jgi:hypothetical protein
MTRDDHGNLLRNAVADHISDPTSTEIMEQQSLVFLLATARLALRTRHFLAAPFAQENADFRRNTCRPPSVPEVSNWLAIVPRECACLKTVLPARSISHLVQFRVATASAVPEVEKSFDKATKAKQPRLGRNCRIVDVIDVISLLSG